MEQSSLFNLQKLANSKKYSIDNLTDTKQVCNRPCILLEVGASYLPTPIYISPDSHDDPDAGWINEIGIYDDNVVTSGISSVIQHVWGSPIELLLDTPILCAGFRLYAGNARDNAMKINIHYWQGGEWIQTGTGDVVLDEWQTRLLPSPVVLEKVRVFFYSEVIGGADISFSEFDFITNKVLDVSLHDGFNDSAVKKHRIVLAKHDSVSNIFHTPIFFAEGLRIVFAEAVGSVFVKYLVL